MHVVSTKTESEPNSHERCEFGDVARKRQLSRQLVALCVQLNDYRDAAAVVSGSTDVFTGYSRRIKEVIECADRQPSRVSFTADLEPILDNAQQEIAYFQQWANDVLATLPDEEDTAPLRAAFNNMNSARSRLLNDVITASDKYIEAQANAHLAQSLSLPSAPQEGRNVSEDSQ